MTKLELLPLVIILSLTKAVNSQEYEPLRYASPVDLSKWWLGCDANVTKEGSIKLVLNGIGTIASKSVLPSDQVNFEVEIVINSTTDFKDGYAIYITPNSSVSWKECCFWPSYRSSCENSHLGVLKPPGLTFGFRVWSGAKIATMFPDNTSISYDTNSINDDPFKSAGFAWPTLFKPPFQPYFLGSCPSSLENPYGRMAAKIRLLDGNITVVMSSRNGDGDAVADYKCADNVPAPGLVRLIQRGDAVLVVSGGGSFYSNVFVNPDANVESIRFNAIGNPAQPTSTGITITKDSATITLSTAREPETIEQATAPSTTPQIAVANQRAAAMRQIVASEMASASQELQKSIFPKFEEKAEPLVKATVVLEECKHFDPNRVAPPANDKGSATFVNASFAVDDFLEIDTVSQTISVSGGLLLSWTISTCPANSSDEFTKRQPEEMYVAQTSEVWTPPYEFVSAKGIVNMQKTDDFSDDFTAIMSKPEVSQNRTLQFYWFKNGVFDSSCKLDLTKFPFDSQTCAFNFLLLRSTSLVQFANEPKFIWPDVDEQDNIDEWHYAGKDILSTTMFYHGHQTSALFFFVTMERNPSYYVSNIILPSGLLVVMELVSYIIQPNIPDRASISITILLAMTVAQSTANSLIPKTSQRILLVDYINAISWICAASTAYQMLACRYATRLDESKDKMEPAKLRRQAMIVRIVDGAVAFLTLAAFLGINIYLCRVASL